MTGDKITKFSWGGYQIVTGKISEKEMFFAKPEHPFGRGDLILLSDGAKTVDSGVVTSTTTREAWEFQTVEQRFRAHPATKESFFDMLDVGEEEEIMKVSLQKSQYPVIGDKVKLCYESSRSGNLLSVTGPIEDKRSDGTYSVRDINDGDNKRDQRRILTPGFFGEVASIQWGIIGDPDFSFRTTKSLGYRWDTKQKLGTMLGLFPEDTYISHL